MMIIVCNGAPITLLEIEDWADLLYLWAMKDFISPVFCFLSVAKAQIIKGQHLSLPEYFVLLLHQIKMLWVHL